jgi:hypothetical protein
MKRFASLSALLGASGFALVMILTAGSTVAVTVGCSGGGSGGSGGSGGGSDPELTCPEDSTGVTTASLHADIIGKGTTCVAAGCHSSVSPGAGAQDMSTPAATQAQVNKASQYADASKSLKIVDGAGKSLQNSSMWLKLLGGGGTHRGP